MLQGENEPIDDIKVPKYSFGHTGNLNKGSDSVKYGMNIPCVESCKAANSMKVNAVKPAFVRS